MKLIISTGRKIYNKKGFDLIMLDQSVDEFSTMDSISKLILTLKADNRDCILYVNNDVNLSHLNNMIMLGTLTEYDIKKLSLYNGAYLLPKDVQVFTYEDDKFREIPCGEYGFEVKWISEKLNELFDATINIQESIRSHTS